MNNQESQPRNNMSMKLILVGMACLGLMNIRFLALDTVVDQFKSIKSVASKFMNDGHKLKEDSEAIRTDFKTVRDTSSRSSEMRLTLVGPNIEDWSCPAMILVAPPRIFRPAAPIMVELGASDDLAPVEAALRLLGPLPVWTSDPYPCERNEVALGSKDNEPRCMSIEKYARGECIAGEWVDDCGRIWATQFCPSVHPK